MISLKEKTKIEKEAKEVLDKFAKALAKVKTSVSIEKSTDQGYRKEGNGAKPDPDFRKLFFANAPKIKGDNIISEKKKW